MSTSHLRAEVGGGGNGADRDDPTNPMNDGGGRRFGSAETAETRIDSSSSQSEVGGSMSDVGMSKSGTTAVVGREL